MFDDLKKHWNIKIRNAHEEQHSTVVDERQCLFQAGEGWIQSSKGNIRVELQETDC